MATLFTRIIQGEIPCCKVAENEQYFAFLDIKPLTKGHTLVIPKIEIDYIFDLEDKTLEGLTLFAKKIALNMRLKLGCKRVAIVVSGMEVPHAHIHLIPMNSEDDINFKNERLNLSEEEFNEIKNLIAI